MGNIFLSKSGGKGLKGAAFVTAATASSAQYFSSLMT
jgi:hypothetical protein